MRFLIIKKNNALQKSYMRVDVKHVLRAGMMPVRTWGVHAVVMASTERLKLKRQVAAAAGKKNTTSLLLFMEANGLRRRIGTFTLATQYWAEGVSMGKGYHEQMEAWMKQVREFQMWRQVREPAGAVKCEARNLGFRWPHWHTLNFSDETRIDMRCVPTRR